MATSQQRILHPFGPLFGPDSRVLILGSFPSVKSREQNFFYGHPQNRFWRVLASVIGVETPQTIEERRDFLLSHGIAVWDVIASCEIEGSADNTIRAVQPNDISVILSSADIRAIFVNGRTSEKYYNKFVKEAIGREAILLPSTSPANAAVSLDALTDAWGVIKEYIL